MKAEKSKKKIMAPVVALLATAIILAVAMAGTAQAALDKRSNVYEANMCVFRSIVTGSMKMGIKRPIFCPS